MAHGLAVDFIAGHVYQTHFTVWQRIMTVHVHSIGFLSGALFRSTRGPKAAAIAGTVGMLAASALVLARNTVDPNM